MWRLSNCSLDSATFTISGELIKPVDKVRNLRVILDSGLFFEKHILGLVSSCYYNLRQLRTIRKALTEDLCHALVRALVISRLDYCNDLLVGLPKVLLDQLNGVMRAAARLVLQLPRNSHIRSDMRNKLHWLDFPARSIFKLCVIAYIAANEDRLLHICQNSSFLCQQYLDAPICDHQRLEFFWSQHVERLHLDQGRSHLPAQLPGTLFRLIYAVLMSVCNCFENKSKLFFSICSINSI